MSVEHQGLGIAITEGRIGSFGKLCPVMLSGSSAEYSVCKGGVA